MRFCLAFLLLTSNCAAFKAPVPDPKAAAYTAELQECVAEYNTRAEIDTCRKQVDAKYGQ
jgi:hypothetical protein